MTSGALLIQYVEIILEKKLLRINELYFSHVELLSASPSLLSHIWSLIDLKLVSKQVPPVTIAMAVGVTVLPQSILEAMCV